MDALISNRQFENELKPLLGKVLVDFRSKFLHVHGGIWQAPEGYIRVFDSILGKETELQVRPAFSPSLPDDRICCLGITANQTLSNEETAPTRIVFSGSESWSTIVVGVEAFLDRRCLYSNQESKSAIGISAIRLDLQAHPPVHIWHDQNQGEEELTIWDADKRLSTRFRKLERLFKLTF